MPHSLSIQDALSRLGAGFQSASAGIMLLRISAFFVLLRPALSERHRMCSAAPPRSVCQIRKLPALSRNGRAGSFIAVLMCQCPKRADFISTRLSEVIENLKCMCQCPKRADFISTNLSTSTLVWTITGVNALSGLISFLQYPLETLINTGFPGSVLQVFVRIF